MAEMKEKQRAVPTDDSMAAMTDAKQAALRAVQLVANWAIH